MSIKIKKSWDFVGHGVQIEDGRIGYFIAHPAPDETLDSARERAKKKLLSNVDRCASPCGATVKPKEECGLEEGVKKVLKAGLATGHADNWLMLLDEVLDQYKELQEKYLEIKSGVDTDERP